MELPNTVLGVLLVVLSPVGLGAIVSWWNDNWRWFKGLESGQKTMFITALALAFTVLYYLVTHVIKPEVFSQLDELYTTSMPFILFIIGAWGFHSKVTNAGANKNTTVTASTSTTSSSASSIPVQPAEPKQPVPPAPPVLEGADG